MSFLTKLILALAPARPPSASLRRTGRTGQLQLPHSPLSHRRRRRRRSQSSLESSSLRKSTDSARRKGKPLRLRTWLTLLFFVGILVTLAVMLLVLRGTVIGAG